MNLARPACAGNRCSALVLVLEFVLFSALSPYFLNVDTLSDATFNFTERAVIALPLALLIIAGEIDISVAAIIALASVAMGLAPRAGVGTPGSVAIGLGTGLVGRMINGALVTIGRVPSIVATIGTMTLFRGVAYAVLGDRVLKDYPASFAMFGQGYLGRPAVRSSWRCSIVLAIVFGVFLHRTRWGRAIYAMGANPIAAASPACRWIAIASRCSRDGPVQRPCGGVADVAPRLDPAVDRAGLGAGDHQHGHPGRRLGVGRQGHHPRRGARGGGARPRDISVWGS